MQIRLLVITSILVLCAIAGYAQRRAEPDSLIIESGDTVAIKSYATRYNPRKALLYASVVPGLGQIYNKKYWKLPLVYGGAFLIGRQINIYNSIYKEYKVYLFENLESHPGEESYPHPDNKRTTAQIRRVVDRSRRERDFWIIMVGALYVLQIVDAHVDAHLKEFDLNPNLRVSIHPTMEQNTVLGRQTGLSLTMKF